MAKKKNISPDEGFSEVLLYTTPNGKVKVEIYVQDETIWLTQQKIADLFGVQRPAITKHLKNIFRIFLPYAAHLYYLDTGDKFSTE